MIERKEGREYDGRGNGTERDLCNDEFYGGWGGVGCGKGIYIYIYIIQRQIVKLCVELGIIIYPELVKHKIKPIYYCDLKTHYRLIYKLGLR